MTRSVFAFDYFASQSLRDSSHSLLRATPQFEEGQEVLPLLKPKNVARARGYEIGDTPEEERAAGIAALGEGGIAEDGAVGDGNGGSGGGGGGGGGLPSRGSLGRKASVVNSRRASIAAARRQSISVRRESAVATTRKTSLAARRRSTETQVRPSRPAIAIVISSTTTQANVQKKGAAEINVSPGRRRSTVVARLRSGQGRLPLPPYEALLQMAQAEEDKGNWQGALENYTLCFGLDHDPSLDISRFESVEEAIVFASVCEFFIVVGSGEVIDTQQPTDSTKTARRREDLGLRLAQASRSLHEARAAKAGALGPHGGPQDRAATFCSLRDAS